MAPALIGFTNNWAAFVVCCVIAFVRWQKHQQTIRGHPIVTLQ